MVMPKQAKIFVGSLVASVAALTLIAGAVMAQDSGQSGGCGCCKNMGQMSQPSSSTSR